MVTEAPGYRHPAKAIALLKRGWKRCYVTIYDEETTDKVVACMVYLPPATNKEALERMLDLWSI